MLFYLTQKVLLVKVQRFLVQKKQAGMPVSSNFLGRVVDPLGNPIDGLGPIEAAEMRPIEEPRPKHY